MWQTLLADVIVVVHLGFIAFVLGGEIAIVIGAFTRWGWVRNLIFRLLHLLAIVIVAGQAIFGIECPLTTWERSIRINAGQLVEEDISFIGRIVRDVLFYEAPDWVFATIYVTFALMVIATLIFVPPRWKRRFPDAEMPA